MTSPIDWNVAEATALRWGSPGPTIDRDEARAVVTELRHAAARAVEPVAEVTGLLCPVDTADTVVVDRPAWIRSALAGFRTVVDPALAEKLDVSGFASSVGPRVTGVQLGGVMAFLSGKVLGQYEALYEPGQRPRLLLVAPNIRAAEIALDVNPSDFRLWVALHEETHRVQFGAVPWLSDYLRALATDLVGMAGTDAGELMGRLGDMLRAVRAGDSLAEAIQNPEQRALLDRATALMSLLEGHADHVMDIAAPALIPTLPTIRAKFEVRRRSAGTFEGLFRRLVGMDAKMRQYAEGAAFVRAVVDQRGMSGFNAVWESPESLPTLAEIREPTGWLERTA